MVDETQPFPYHTQVWLAWFDEGGAGKATHTYDGQNHGSCELNPCTGVNATYLNTFRKDANISISYTKPYFEWQNKAWADRWAGNKTLVPMDEFYVGWMTVRLVVACAHTCLNRCACGHWRLNQS